MSSFFQSLTEDPYAWVGPDNAKKADDIENIVRSMSFDELKNLFYRYCECIDGFGESIFIICEELRIELDELSFSAKSLVGENEFDNFTLYLLRFDLMLPHLSDVLTYIMKRPISLRPSNLASSRWYAERYIEFKKHLRIPSDVIERIYKSRRSLMDLFYPGQYDAILSKKILQYGNVNNRD